MTPEAHDDAVAYLSHLPQIVASALMHLVGEKAGEDGLALAGRGLRDTTRLASSPADIWRDIALTNHDNIGPAIDELIEVLVRMKSGSDAIASTFESAARWKRVLDAGRDPA
jgi:prephenate dehydrogenase